MDGLLMQDLNIQNSLDNMVPLTRFSDAEEVQKLEKIGYHAGYTVDSWKAEFPKVDPKYVLCTMSLVLPSGLYYCDREHYICFKIKNGSMFTLLPEQNESYADCLERVISRSMKYYDERDYDKLLFFISDEESGGIAIPILCDMLEKEKPNPKLYSTALSTYTLCSNGTQYLSSKAWQNLLLCKSEEQKAETDRKLEKFGKTITVYRGQADGSTPYTKACSWTVNINAAYFFASWRSQEGSCVYTGNVGKKDIIEYVDESSEKEILVLPGTVTNVTKVSMVEWDVFNMCVSAKMFDRKHRFPKESYPQNVREALETLYKDTTGSHDRNHSWRVALLANFIYRMEILSPLTEGDKSSYMEAYHLYSDLVNAVIYHDAGRKDDSENTEHGAAGYEQYKKDRGENKVVEFLTSCHCRPDSEAKEYWEKAFPDNQLIWKALCVLKDADALDRVRFNFGNADYLDINMLRMKSSNALVPIAKQLLEADYQ